MYESNGTLRVRTFTAGGALPISDAVVRIIGADEDNARFARSLVTDRDGVGVFKNIPAPRIEYSLSPDTSELPFATYELEVFADGYARQKISDVTVFSGIESFQPINLIPQTQGDQI